MDTVVSRLEDIIKGVGWWKIRSRVVSKGECAITRVVRFPRHWARQLSYQLTLASPSVTLSSAS